MFSSQNRVIPCQIVWSLPSSLSQFRMVLEIYPTEFSLLWWFHDIDQCLAMAIATCFYVFNYLHWITVGMKIGKSIAFEVENPKMKVKTLQKIRSWLKCRSYQYKKQNKIKQNKKYLNWSVVVKLLQKISKCNFD